MLSCRVDDSKVAPPGVAVSVLCLLLLAKSKTRLTRLLRLGENGCWSCSCGIVKAYIVLGRDPDPEELNEFLDVNCCWLLRGRRLFSNGNEDIGPDEDADCGLVARGCVVIVAD